MLRCDARLERPDADARLGSRSHAHSLARSLRYTHTQSTVGSLAELLMGDGEGWEPLATGALSLKLGVLAADAQESRPRRRARLGVHEPSLVVLDGRGAPRRVELAVGVVVDREVGLDGAGEGREALQVLAEGHVEDVGDVVSLEPRVRDSY